MLKRATLDELLNRSGLEPLESRKLDEGELSGVAIILHRTDRHVEIFGDLLLGEESGH
jgi:hypothetical protein